VVPVRLLKTIVAVVVAAGQTLLVLMERVRLVAVVVLV